MHRKNSLARWCLMGFGLLGALGILNSDFLGVFAQQSTANLQLLPLQIIGQSNLKNLVLGVIVRNTGTSDVTFRLGFSLRKVGQLTERPDGAEVGECFISDCAIKGRGADNPAAPPIEKVIQLILKISQNEILEQNSTYQLNVFLQPYNVDNQGCGNRVCVGKPFFKYDTPEIRPIMLELNPPSPAPEGTKIFVKTLIENTGVSLPAGSKMDASFKYCLQLSTSPCDPDIEFKRLNFDSSKLSALAPPFVGSASTMAIPVDEKTENLVILDTDQLKLTGVLRVKVALRLTLPANADGTPNKEADESNNEILTPYRILSKISITKFFVSTQSHLGNTGVITYFDRNRSELCLIGRANVEQAMSLTDISTATNCYKFDINEVSDILINTSANDEKSCDIYLARPDGKISRTRCYQASTSESADKLHLLKPNAKIDPKPFTDPTLEREFINNNRFDPSSSGQNIRVDIGKRLNQMLSIERFNKILISTARGKIWSMDAVKAESFDQPNFKVDPTPVLDVVDGSIDLMKFVGQNIIAVVNSRLADKGLLYLIRPETNGRFTSLQFKLGNISDSAPIFESKGRILAVEQDGENKRLIIATSQSVTYYTWNEPAIPVLVASPISTCAAPANTEIRDMIFFKRDFVAKNGKDIAPTFIVATGLSTKGGNEGEVQFFNVTGRKVDNCTTSRIETPNAAPLTTNGPISKLVRAIDLPFIYSKTAPDQPTFMLASSLDGRIYPFRVGIRDGDPDKLLAQFAPNDENSSTPFLPAQPLQRGPFIDAGAFEEPENINLFVFYVSDMLYCKRYVPLKDALKDQLIACNSKPGKS